MTLCLNPPGTPGYQAAYNAATGVRAVLEPRETGHGWCTVSDLLDAYERSREFRRLAPRTRTDYLKGLADVRARYGGAPLGIINSVALKGNVLDWVALSRRLILKPMRGGMGLGPALPRGARLRHRVRHPP